MQKVSLCPNGVGYCGYSEGKTCIVFSNEQLFNTEKMFDCEVELKKLRYRPRLVKDKSLSLF